MNSVQSNGIMLLHTTTFAATLGRRLQPFHQRDHLCPESKMSATLQKNSCGERHRKYFGNALSRGSYDRVQRCRFVPVRSELGNGLDTSTVEAASSVLHKASENFSVPPSEVFDAMRTLEAAKLPAEGWDTMLGGSQSPGKRWRLVFTSGTKEVQKALRGTGKGAGRYFPLTAAQRWDSETGTIENGVYLGHIASLTFSGPYAMKGRKLTFDFDTLNIKIGPFKSSFALKEKINDYVPSKKDPFFLFFYVDEKVVAARGRSGGIAFWAKTTPAWELEKGIA